MKNLIIFTLSLLPLLAHSAPLLRSRIKNSAVEILQQKQKLSLKSELMNEYLAVKPCNKKNAQRFAHHIHELFQKTLPFKASDSLSVEVSGETKTISPHSPMGAYLKNIDQHLLTLKREMEIACTK